MKKYSLNLLIAVITLNILVKDWSLSLRLWNGFTFGIGSWFGNCFEGLVCHLNNGRIEIKLHYKYSTSYVGLSLYKGKEFKPFTYYNSEHIAEAYGKASEQDWGTIYQYVGILGRHDSI